MLTFYFRDAGGEMIEDELLTSGMVGKQVTLDFSAEWEKMVKTVVFTAGAVTRDVVAVTENVITIPAEILAVPMQQLYVGVYGVSPDGRVTPTVYAKGPLIYPGTDPSGDEGTEPDLPIWAQIRLELDTVRADASPAQIRQMVADCLEENPPVDLSGYVRTVNGIAPDENGDVEITIPEDPGNPGVVLNAEQFAALDGLFRACAFVKGDVSAEYAAFLNAFRTAEVTA